MDLVVRLHKHHLANGIPYRICFVPDPVAWTEAPESRRILGRQRDRWQRGLSEVILRHRDMLLNPRYGRIGTLAFPHFFFLEVWGPLLEATGYAAFLVTLLMGWASAPYIACFFMIAVGLGIFLSVIAVGLEELSFRRYPRGADLAWFVLLSLIENLGYRQLTAYWRIRGMVSFLRRKKGWGDMARRGFQVAPAKPDQPASAAAPRIPR
jgi:cellulose synthase/poly-beta-1,6-N-acetylglucosamine synthase-like glycosyltransferase